MSSVSKLLFHTVYKESCDNTHDLMLKRPLSSETSYAIITEEWVFNGLINDVRDEHCHFSQLSSWNESTLTHWLLAHICCTTESSRQHAAQRSCNKTSIIPCWDKPNGPHQYIKTYIHRAHLAEFLAVHS